MGEIPSGFFKLTVRTVSNNLNIYGVFTLFPVIPAAADKTEEQKGLLPCLHEGQG